tara:strand:- start:494 stop:781 length:288 start_codon:yes stop_codon:yes gene_type:complete
MAKVYTTVTLKNGWKTEKVREVKNLGWLLRHWKEVTYFDVSPSEFGPGGAHLVAVLKDSVRYETEFACASVLRGWLKRPVFKGVRLFWFNYRTVC